MKPITFRPIRTQAVAYDGSAAVTDAFGSGIYTLRIVATTACHYALGAAPTATTNNPYLPTDAIELIQVHPAEKIAFIKASGSTAGTAYTIELSL